MRRTRDPQFRLGSVGIEDIALDPKPRGLRRRAFWRRQTAPRMKGPRQAAGAVRSTARLRLPRFSSFRQNPRKTVRRMVLPGRKALAPVAPGGAHPNFSPSGRPRVRRSVPRSRLPRVPRPGGGSHLYGRRVPAHARSDSSGSARPYGHAAGRRPGLPHPPAAPQWRRPRSSALFEFLERLVAATAADQPPPAPRPFPCRVPELIQKPVHSQAESGLGVPTGSASLHADHHLCETQQFTSRRDWHKLS